MEIKYRNTKSDFESAITSFYLNLFYKVGVFFSLLLVLIVGIIYVKEGKVFINIFYFFTFFYIIIFLKNGLIPIIQFKRNLNIQIKNNLNYFSEETFNVKDEGFEINSKRYNETQYFNWQSIKYTYSTFKYYLIVLHNEKIILINKTNSEPDNILPNIIGIIEQNKSIKRNQKGNFNSNKHQNEIKNNTTLYWIGCLGIIPNVGVIVGIILSIIGIVRKDFKLIFIGIVDILFTIIFWAILTQIRNSDFSKNGFSKILTEMTQRNLNDLVKQIEFFKTVNGKYPEKLKQIENKKSFIFTNEIFETEKSEELYYKKENEKYILKSFGPDKKINTKDDIYPTIKIDSTRIGFRKKL
jgi:hypothetical protein